jgi:hypothetical protein
VILGRYILVVLEELDGTRAPLVPAAFPHLCCCLALFVQSSLSLSVLLEEKLLLHDQLSVLFKEVLINYFEI